MEAEDTPAGRRGRSLVALVVMVGAMVLAFVVVRDGKAMTAPAATPTPRAVGAAGSGGPTIDGIPCNTYEQLTYHEHAHLDIRYRGRPVALPANIGITGGCFYWLHTHDESGIIHMEAPHSRVFTLGEFFDIAGFPLSRSRIGDLSTGRKHTMRIWVNLKPYPGDPRAIRLRPHESITIEIGPPFPRPQRYSWPAGY